MIAVLLAGGKGTRLRPYTISLPKPLMPVGDYPILEIMIRQLKNAGVRKFIIAVGHLESLIRAYFGNGSKWGVEIEYSSEDEPLGTAGPMRLVRDRLSESFFFMNGDTLSDWDFKNMARFHVENNNSATIGVARRSVKIDFGVVDVDTGNDFARWKEKPTFSFLVSAGIYVLEPKVIDYIPEHYFNVPNLVEKLYENSEVVRCYEHDGHWLDIGRVDDYKEACRLVDEEGVSFE